MKRYIVVKHNTIRDQKFYLLTSGGIGWTLEKSHAHKFLLRRNAQKIVNKRNRDLALSSPALAQVVRYVVEVA